MHPLPPKDQQQRFVQIKESLIFVQISIIFYFLILTRSYQIQILI